MVRNHRAALHRSAPASGPPGMEYKLAEGRLRLPGHGTCSHRLAHETTKAVLQFALPALRRLRPLQGAGDERQFARMISSGTVTGEHVGSQASVSAARLRRRRRYGSCRRRAQAAYGLGFSTPNRSPAPQTCVAGCPGRSTFSVAAGGDLIMGEVFREGSRSAARAQLSVQLRVMASSCFAPACAVPRHEHLSPAVLSVLPTR